MLAPIIILNCPLAFCSENNDPFTNRFHRPSLLLRRSRFSVFHMIIYTLVLYASLYMHAYYASRT
jgi:hypothetical protein